MMQGKINADFNMAAEASRLFNDFPYLRSKAIFINTDDNLHLRNPYAEGVRFYKSPEIAKDDVLKHVTIQELRDLLETTHKVNSSMMYPKISMEYSEDDLETTTMRHDFSVVVIKPDDGFADVVPQRLAQQSQIFKINHEAAHAVNPGARGAGTSIQVSESISDVFGGIRHLQRFGNDTELLSHISWFRAYAVLFHGDGGHFTSPAVDKLIADAKQKPFGDMTQKEYVRVTSDYANNNHFSPEEVEIAKINLTQRSLRSNPFVRQVSLADYISGISSTALSTSDKAAFYIGARFFQPFLHPEGAVFMGQHMGMNERERQGMLQRFELRARALGYHDMAKEFEENRKGNFNLQLARSGHERRGPIRLKAG